MNKLFIILFLLTALCAGAIHAVPAKRVVQSVTQPDGSTLTVVLQGDEHFHFVTTVDGMMLQESPDGSMRYATVTARGELAAGEYIAHDPERRETGEIAYIKQIDTERISQAVRDIRATNTKRYTQTVADTKKINFPNQGTVRGLIILAQYKDVKFSPAHTRDEFHDMMNAEGYSNYNATGSARDYFIDQSSGMFTPEFDVVGPVTLPQNMRYYGGNSLFGQDINPAEMIVDACYAADTLLNVDFSQYDFNDDGMVDLVFVIYAGYAEAQGGPSTSVWPHAWDLENGGFKDIRMDGKLIHSYACSSELNGAAGTTIDGIGTFCHEFSHCLGLPDIYDTRNSGVVGMGPWSVMDHGSYNNNSRTPAGYSAYERYTVGWLTPIILNELQKGVELPPLNLSNQAYMVVSDQNPDEYYTIENRQQSGWDTYLPGHGMMIVHVDYDPALWQKNVINTKYNGHAHLQIVPADNELTDFTGDLFPGTTRNTSFTDESTPASVLYSGGFLNKSLTGIQEDQGVVTFDFMHFFGTPVATSATDITAEGFTANWEPVYIATSYVLEVAACMTGRMNLSEEFAGFAEGTPSAADEREVSGELDSFTESNGWTGDKVYQAGGYVCLGYESSGGSLTTPLLDLSREKEFTLSCRAEGSKNLQDGYNLQLLDVDGNVLLNKDLIMTASDKILYWTIKTEAKAGRIRITTKAPALLDYFRLYDGYVRKQLDSGEELVAPEDYMKKISGITEPSYALTGLDNNKRYIYHVYACLDEEVSETSNKVIVETHTPSGIETHSMLKAVYAKAGALCFNTESKEAFSIYTSSGVRISAGISMEGFNEIPLPSGFYILAVGAERFKVYVP